MKLPELSDYAPMVGESFAVAIGASSVTMVLAEAKPLGAIGQSRAFELIFRSMSPVVLPAQLYMFDNPTLGQMGIFISPFARDSSGIVYQAVFS